MKRIKRLINPKNATKAKIEMPKIHALHTPGKYGVYINCSEITWCRISGPLPYGDSVLSEVDYLQRLKHSDNYPKRNYCSCCDNAIIRTLRQRTLGI